MIICAIYVTTDGEEIATNIKLKEKKLKISVFLKKTDAPIKRKTSTTFALRIPLIKNLAKIHDGSFNVNSTTKKGTFMVCELLEVAQHEQKNIEKTA